MVEIKEFCALHYNIDKLKKQGLSLSEVICPPYDVISSELQHKLLKQKYNFVNLELPRAVKGKSKYISAKQKLVSWKRNKIVVKDSIPAIYLLQENFFYPPLPLDKNTSVKSSVKQYTRTGLFCIVKLDPEYKTILPHEHTKPKPVEDRLELIKTLKVQTSAVFCLVPDKDKKFLNWIQKIVSQLKPIVIFKDSANTEHKIYKLVSKEKIDTIKKFFKNKKLIIADGHHRYKTALLYHKYLLDQKKTKSSQIELLNSQYFMAYICSLSDDGLLILPTHRAVAGKFIEDSIHQYFDLHDWDGKELVKLVLYHKGEFKVMRIKHKLKLNLPPLIKDTPSVILNETVLKNVPKEQIFYHYDMKETISWADKYQGYAFLLEPISKEVFQQAVLNSYIFPPKTTYFYPKIMAGELFFDFS